MINSRNIGTFAMLNKSNKVLSSQLKTFCLLLLFFHAQSVRSMESLFGITTIANVFHVCFQHSLDFYLMWLVATVHYKSQGAQSALLAVFLSSKNWNWHVLETPILRLHWWIWWHHKHDQIEFKLCKMKYLPVQDIFQSNKATYLR